MIVFLNCSPTKQATPQRCTGFLSERADAHCFNAVHAYGAMVADKLSIQSSAMAAALWWLVKRVQDEKPRTFTFLDLNTHLCYTHVFWPLATNKWVSAASIFHFTTLMGSNTRFPPKQPMHHILGCSQSAPLHLYPTQAPRNANDRMMTAEQP